MVSGAISGLMVLGSIRKKSKQEPQRVSKEYPSMASASRPAPRFELVS